MLQVSVVGSGLVWPLQYESGCRVLVELLMHQMEVDRVPPPQLAEHGPKFEDCNQLYSVRGKNKGV